MKNKVIYHADCADGFTSAYLFWKWVDGNAEFIPMHYPCKEITGVDKDTNVWFLDFSASFKQTKELCAKAGNVYVLDHHKTARDTMLQLLEEGLENLEITFDMERSGCRIVWDYCKNNPNTISTITNCDVSGGDFIPPAWLVNYVEDRDLWRFKLKDSKEINEYIHACTNTFESWGLLEEEDPNSLVHSGAAILAHTSKQVAKIVKTAYLSTVTGPNGTVYEVPFVNTQTNISEVLHELAKTATFAVAWWEDGKTRKYSLRVDEKTNFDGTIIARHHGGGGHAKACGWTECVK